MHRADGLYEPAPHTPKYKGHHRMSNKAHRSEEDPMTEVTTETGTGPYAALERVTLATNGGTGRGRTAVHFLTGQARAALWAWTESAPTPTPDPDPAIDAAGFGVERVMMHTDGGAGQMGAEPLYILMTGARRLELWERALESRAL